ncbi:type II toxin-antitoxin system ParD family antitoxin [Pseudanabaena sp. PCC 6802]|uniref:type II toxin-antitoxin system ParD family antitoxin n=1 Tax=Pseudanabaena sp. PCC 6802 TaxID=118173 RepID=UPI000349044A|nr:type II toxin-antitoxin system ParD family antitoxin [Pseudanabaena sp. PCC 6802]
MTTLNISLPDAMKEFIQEQTKAEGYSTASEYLRHLVRQEQKRVAQAKLDAMLLEGLNSGESIEINDEWWEQMKASLVDKLNK